MKKYLFLFIIISLIACKSENTSVKEVSTSPVAAEMKKANADQKLKTEKQLDTEDIVFDQNNKNEIDKKESENSANNTKDSKPLESKKVTSTSAQLDKPNAVLPKAESPKNKVYKKVAKKDLGKMEFEELVYDFGEIEAGDIVQHDFHFTNTGKAPLSVANASATCGCTVPSFPFIPIEPGGKGFIGVRYNSVGKEGPQEPLITVISNGNPQVVKVKLKGTVKKKEKS